MAEWQPIATAPPDAIWNAVLLYWPYWTEEPVIGNRMSEEHPDIWWTEKWLGDDAADPGPTHWYPLPDTPKEKGLV